MGAPFAVQAAVVLALQDRRRKIELRVQNLEQAVISRDIIGRAKGILMEREGWTADDAFETLRQVSQRLNRKLREVAETVVTEIEGKDRKPSGV